MPLDFNQLETFLHVIDTGSFSGAAIRIGLTQPAVSLQIRTLEKYLGVRLVERVGKRAMPSAAGQELARYAQRLQAEVRSAEAHMKRYAGKQLGRVRIGTGSTASIHLLPQVLRRIRNTAPEIEISVITGDSASMADALSENLIDLALINLPRQRRGLVVERTLADPLVGVVPRSAGDVPPALTPGDFKRLPLILYERGGAMRRVIDDWFLSAHVTVQPSMELGDVEGAKRFVSAGLGWSILPSIAVSNKDPDILTRPLRPGLRRSLAVMLRQDKVRDHAIRSALRAFASL